MDKREPPVAMPFDNRFVRQLRDLLDVDDPEALRPQRTTVRQPHVGALAE